MKITINKYEWGVKLEPADSEKMNPAGGDGCAGLDGYAGLTEYISQTISIRDGLSKERTRDVVIHELVHAYLDSYGYNTDCLSEEEMCRFISAQIDRIMYDTETIMEGLKK